jgi:hypothetical protein
MRCSVSEQRAAQEGDGGRAGYKDAEPGRYVLQVEQTWEVETIIASGNASPPLRGP